MGKTVLTRSCVFAGKLMPLGADARISDSLVARLPDHRRSRAASIVDHHARAGLP